MTTKSVLVNGATGYLGRPLCELAALRGHRVRAFVRPGSEGRAPSGVDMVVGDPLSSSSLGAALRRGDTLVHLVGTPRPSPAKAAEFAAVDRVSIRAATEAARQAAIAHLVYVSVAHPAPIMQAYIDVRVQGEAWIRETGIPATILRPWYVLGPGHRWPYALLPLYDVFSRLASTRETARRLGLVTRTQIIAALVIAIERGPDGHQVVDVPGIARDAAALDLRAREG